MNKIPFALLASTLLFSSAKATEPPKPTSPPVPISVAKVQRQQIPALIEVAGTLQAAESAVIAAKVTGTVTKVPVVLGSSVKKGDLLVAIEPFGPKDPQAAKNPVYRVTGPCQISVGV